MATRWTYHGVGTPTLGVSSAEGGVILSNYHLAQVRGRGVRGGVVWGSIWTKIVRQMLV